MKIHCVLMVLYAKNIKLWRFYDESHGWEANVPISMFPIAAGPGEYVEIYFVQNLTENTTLGLQYYNVLFLNPLLTDKNVYKDTTSVTK